MIPEFISISIIISIVLILIYLAYDRIVNEKKSREIKVRVSREKAEALIAENLNKLSKYRQALSNIEASLLVEKSEDIVSILLEQKMILEFEIKRLSSESSYIYKAPTSVNSELQAKYDQLRDTLESLLVMYEAKQNEYNSKIIEIEPGEEEVIADEYIDAYEQLTNAYDAERSFAYDNYNFITTQQIVDIQVPPCSVYRFREDKCTNNCHYISSIESSCRSPISDLYVQDAAADRFLGKCPADAQTREECEVRNITDPKDLHKQCQFVEAGEPSCVFKNW